MDYTDGFYKFSIEDDGLYFTVYPAFNGGRKTTIDEIFTYVEICKIQECDMMAVRDAIEKCVSEPVTVRVSMVRTLPSNEFGDYKIDTNKLRLTAVFYPPFEGSETMNFYEIQKDLKNLGVIYGIKESAITDFMRERTYGKTYVLAEGKPTREGYDAKIVYNFNTELKPTPKINSDGSVDYHDLEIISHVRKGDSVATIIPEDPGEEGVDVFGNTILPHKVKKAFFKYGKNMHITSDGLNLISDVSGHVTLENEKVFVSKLLEVVDVDMSTGNIDYDGDINIKGNVLSGFSVKATGNIHVSGCVEGAIIEAGGNVTIVRGVQGMNKAVIKAGGNIVSKFIESAEKVVAEGNIDVDSILHSNVSSKGIISVLGKNGLIIGGEVKATNLIDVNVIGNKMGTATVVGVGVDAEMKRRIDFLKKDMEVNGNKKLQLNQILTALRNKQEVEGTLPPEKQEMLQKTMRNLLLIEQELNSEKRELEDYRGRLAEDANARIKVHNTAFPGTNVVFGEIGLFLKTPYTYCQFAKDGADVVTLPF